MDKILLLCNDRWHPGQIPVDGTAPLTKKGFHIDVIQNANALSPELLTNYSLVLLSKSDEVSNNNHNSWKNLEIQNAFVDYVNEGGGLLAVHSGTVAGENTSLLDHLLGCRFLSHPEQSLVTVTPLKPHFITKGVEPFQEKDEHYLLEILQEDIDVLFASYSPAQGEEEKYETEPYFNSPALLTTSGYVRRFGEGRICVLTPGHNLSLWLNPSFQKILENAILWCTKKMM